MKGVRAQDSSLRSAFCTAIAHFATAILDYVSNIGEMLDTTVTVAHFNTEANSIYETLFTSWLQSGSKEPSLRLQVTLVLRLHYDKLIIFKKVLEAMAALTPLLSPSLVADRAPQFITTLLQLYKKLGPSSCGLEVTLCLSPMLQLTTTTAPPALLDPVIDPLYNTMFQQICIPMDFEKAGTVKNHHEMLRCYDQMMKHSPEKLVAGLLVKADSSEERLRVGALTVVKHILNLPTEELGQRLETIVTYLTGKLSETNPSVQKVVAQIIMSLGKHGCISGTQGRELVGFIVRLCSPGESSGGKVVATESLGMTCSNILQLLATSVPSAETVLWPHTIDCLLQPDCDASVAAVSRALAHIVAKRGEKGEELAVDWGDFQYATGPSALLARLLVVASVPGPGSRGTHVLRFLLNFSSNINRHVGTLWQTRFPLLLHYLDQGESDPAQWQSWLADLATDSARAIEMEDWTLGLCQALVAQLSLYPSKSSEKSFAIRCIGRLLTLVTNKQAVLDHLSSIFLATVDRHYDETACAQAFGSVASAHLELVLSKCGTLYAGEATRKNTSFFGLIRDRGGEESQVRVIATVVQCVGQATIQAGTPELEASVEAIVKSFFLPCLQDSKQSYIIREAVLTAISQLCSALKAVLSANPSFKLARHEELLHSAIAVLQDQSNSPASRQLALTTLTSLIQLPPNISQLSRCSLLKACFSTIFSAFLEAAACKSEEYSEISELERSISAMVEELHVLINELLRQDMEQSTVDEIFTMLEPWLRLEQDLARQLSVNILLRALETYLKGVKLGVNSPSNFTPGPYMIGAMVARCHDPSRAVRKGALACVQHILRTLALYEGLAQETIETALLQLEAMDARCNGEEREDLSCLSQALVSVLGERVQHHHLLSLLDSLCEAVLDTQVQGADGVLAVLLGLVTSRGSEIFQNIPGFIRKLHDKMELMAVDDLSERTPVVSTVVLQFAVHSTRGVVSALLHLPSLPQDQAARLIWQTLASEPRLAADVLDVLLETVTQREENSEVNSISPVLMAATLALTVMLDTHKLEEICRLELSRLLSGLIMLLAAAVGHAPVSGINPASTCIDSIRSLFSCINCVVVAASLPTACADLTGLAALLHSLVQAVATHAPHHLPAFVAGFPVHQEAVESQRVATLAVLQAATEARGAGDQALLSSMVTNLLRAAGDPSTLARKLALQGVSGLAGCSAVDIEASAAQAVSALLAGLDDMQCASVSLTALQGLVDLLPSLPATQITPLTATASLKVRPYFDSSSEDHRAAAVSVYGALAGFATGEHRSQYLDHAQGWLLPVLLHSSSPHPATAAACLSTMRALATVTQFPPLKEALLRYSTEQGFPALVQLVVAAKCGALVEIYPACVAAGISYYRSTNPLLRANVVLLVGALLESTKGKDMDEELVQSALQGMVGLLGDQDREVRRVAAATVGRVATSTLPVA